MILGLLIIIPGALILHLCPNGALFFPCRNRYEDNYFVYLIFFKIMKHEMVFKIHSIIISNRMFLYKSNQFKENSRIFEVAVNFYRYYYIMSNLSIQDIKYKKNFQNVTIFLKRNTTHKAMGRSVLNWIAINLISD